MEASWLYALLSFFILLVAFRFSAKRKRKLPPSPALSLPMLGHLHYLKAPVHRTFYNLSQKYGPIFSLRLGSRLTVVVSSPTIVEECFTKNDIVLANRPRFIMGKHAGYNYTSMVDSPYGEHWRNLRRLTSTEVFSTARLNMSQPIRQDEVRLLLQKLYKESRLDFAKANLRNLFSELSFNVVTRMVSGNRYFGVNEDNEEAKEFVELTEELFRIGGVSNPGDYLPLLRWIDYKGYEKNMERIAKRMDAFMQGLIDEHRRKRGTLTIIDHLLSFQEKDPEYYTDAIIKGIIIIMLVGGTDTSVMTIEWAMSALLNHPDCLEKARAEIDNVVGGDRLVDESDVSKLSYLQSVISETFRLFPPSPSLVPHEASADCKIAGYDIPRGTIVIVNSWAVHRDPSAWDDPTTFNPERFAAGEVGPPKMLQFGMGRRICPGNGLAIRVVTLTLASLIQCFEWRRMDEALVDLREGSGLTMPKLVPLEARCKARDVLRNVVAGAA